MLISAVATADLVFKNPSAPIAESTKVKLSDSKWSLEKLEFFYITYFCAFLKSVSLDNVIRATVFSFIVVKTTRYQRHLTFQSLVHVNFVRFFDETINHE
jgi:hypothetical protein